MPKPTPQVTERDQAVLREIARLTAAPAAALIHLFPSQSAAYVRLGILVNRGLVARTDSFGRRAYGITRRGAVAVNLPVPRNGVRETARVSRIATVAVALAKIGYHPVTSQRARLSTTIAWFASSHHRVAVYAPLARINSRRAQRYLAKLRILRHGAHAVILAGNDQTMARRVPPAQYPLVLILPVPLSPHAKELLAGIAEDRIPCPRVAGHIQ